MTKCLQPTGGRTQQGIGWWVVNRLLGFTCNSTYPMATRDKPLLSEVPNPIFYRVASWVVTVGHHVLIEHLPCISPWEVLTLFWWAKAGRSLPSKLQASAGKDNKWQKHTYWVCACKSHSQGELHNEKSVHSWQFDLTWRSGEAVPWSSNMWGKGL